METTADGCTTAPVRLLVVMTVPSATYLLVRPSIFHLESERNSKAVWGTYFVGMQISCKVWAVYGALG